MIGNPKPAPVLDDSGFHPAVGAWFSRTFGAPTEPQALGWPAIAAGRHTLIAAPTGSGKTLAAFLFAIDSLVRQGLAGTLAESTQVLYISPLKALSNDIERNLALPLAGIRKELTAMGLAPPEIRTFVRTGDTKAASRSAMLRHPPHIFVTTPESLFIMLTSEGGRGLLRNVRTVIVDEIHALVGDKRGSHLALSLERLEHLVGQSPSQTSLIPEPARRNGLQRGAFQRIGLSATQKPIEEVARYLVGSGALNAAGDPDCTIVDTGHLREMDLAIELPRSPLETVMALEVWNEIYQRITELIREHHTTLIFVNTRRLAERVAHNLGERLGDDQVTAHHGSLAREQRLDAEQRLKSGNLKALVATASLELGIDIGSVDLVCQLGSTRSIATFLQRVGRSGHSITGTPKGRIFPLSRDELVECAALLHAFRRGDLDRLCIPEKPLDILAQQIVAATASDDWPEADLLTLFRRAYPYRDLTEAEFDAVVTMLADGFATQRGRRGALIHRDAVNGRIRGRKGARLAAITSGGAIPDTADYRVILEPAGTFIGTLNEDFAIESMAGDIFLLGNSSWRILRVEPGKVRVEDARGLPPTIPFWLGEAPGRTRELSEGVSRLREGVAERLRGAPPPPAPRLESPAPAPVGETIPFVVDGGESLNSAIPAATDPHIHRDPAEPDHPLDGAAKPRTAPPWAGKSLDWLTGEVGLTGEAALQIAEYLAAAKGALGEMPTQTTLVAERFFDEAGGMQLIIHAPFGSRHNRAWGLALRKRFCRKFNFELQAAATEDAIVLSLGPTHSFPLMEVFSYLKSATVRDLLVQAVLDAPLFATRWRWNAARSLAVLRWRGGRKVPPQIQRIEAENLLAVVFPDQLACLENVAGMREIPDHPLVNQTIGDCLNEAMDIESLESLLAAIERGEVRLVARDLSEPSPLAQEILNARAYAFLDDAPLEERRTQAVASRRWLDPESADDIGALDAAAVDRVREEAWPQAGSADELHDALVLLGFLTEAEGRQGNRVHVEFPAGSKNRATTGGWAPLLAELAADRRAAVMASTSERPAYWVAAERLTHLRALYPDAVFDPPIDPPEKGADKIWARDEALVEMLRGRLEGSGPITEGALAADLGLPHHTIQAGLAALEADGFAMRGRFTPGIGQTEWCDRRLLARIHRYTLNRLRQEIEPVSGTVFMRFLFRWQWVEAEQQRAGADGLAGLLEQLEGFEAPAAAWESEILPARMGHYDPIWLDGLCLSGRYVWARRTPPATAKAGRTWGPVKATPLSLVGRKNLAYWNEATSWADQEGAAGRVLSAQARQAYDFLATAGASFFDDLAEGTGLLPTQVEVALGELVAWGRVTSDSFHGLRALLTPSGKRPPIRAGRTGSGKHSRRSGSAAFLGMAQAGRWSLLRDPPDGNSHRDDSHQDQSHRDDSRQDQSHRDDSRRAAELFAHEATEAVARTLLRRYGVLFRRLLDREGSLPPWRDLLRVLRRLEARGEIRGGRFVAGFTGEQFALPEALTMLRDARRKPPSDEWISLSAADPLNLLGIVTPGSRVPALATNRILFKNGEPIAVKEGGHERFLTDFEPEAQWEVSQALKRRKPPPILRQYLGVRG